MNLDNVWSMLPEAYCVNFPCELKITSAISQSQRMLPKKEGREQRREEEEKIGKENHIRRQ